MHTGEGRATQAAGGLPSASLMSFTCARHGCERVRADQPYTYFAFRPGCTGAPAILASEAPHGRFYAAGCRQGVGAAAALPSNLTWLDHGCAELARGVADLPQFDFIAIGCDYDRLPPADRQQLVEFIGRRLNPGGIVHVGYSAMPGGSAAHPLQRLLLEYQAAHAGAADGASAAARRSVQALADRGAGYLDANPGMRALWDRLKEQPGGTLNGMQPLYFADVACAFAAAKLDFVGTASPLPSPALTLQQREFLDLASDPVLRETLKDYLHNTARRADLFVRGARRMHPLRLRQWQEQHGLAPAHSHCDTDIRATHELE